MQKKIPSQFVCSSCGACLECVLPGVQVTTGLRFLLVCAWFLKIDPVWIVSMHVCVCVCPRLRLLITRCMMWSDMDLIRSVKQVYSGYMATESLSLMGMALALVHFIDITH